MVHRFRSSLLLASPTLLLALTLFPRSAHADENTTPPKVSIALERVAGVSYTRAFDKDSSAAAALTAMQIGGPTVNPYAAPRLGLDAILDPGVTLGVGFSVARYSLSSTSTSGKSEDVGSLFMYTLTPRVGYRIPVMPELDFTPRAGLTLAGGSVSSGTSNDTAGVFALALSAEGVAAYRATRSFNILGGVGFDYTISASASSSSGTSTTNTGDLKGGLFAVQLWLGLGGYL